MNRLHHPDISALRQYNGFYERPDCRDLIFRLYDGVCQASQTKLAITDAHVGHIVPQSAADFFISLYPSLDVHNVVNLHLLQACRNTKTSDFFVSSPLALHHAVSYSCRLVLERLPKLLSAKAPRKQTELMRAAKICLASDLASPMQDHTHMSIYRYVLEQALDDKGAIQSYDEYRKFAAAIGVRPETAGNYRRWIKFAGTRASMIKEANERERLHRHLKKTQRELTRRTK